jgi:Pectate lyase superfamily protein
MATLIQSLSISGSRKADGSQNAGGFVFLYLPGTTIVTPGYRADDLSATWPTSGGGIQLDGAGKADIWVTQPVDIVVTDQAGTQIDYILGFNRTRAEQVEILGNASFTGALTDPASHSVTQAPGGRTDLNTILSRVATSLGGLDGQYKESTGATARNLADVIRGIAVTPEDFGAKGDGQTDDTTAVSAAVNECKRLGGGVVLFGPKTYLINAAISLANTLGVNFRGSGQFSTVLKQTSGIANVLTFSSCSKFSISDMTLTASGNNSSVALSITGGSGVVLRDVAIDPSALFITGLSVTSASLLRIEGGSLSCRDDVTGHAVLLSSTTKVHMAGTAISGAPLNGGIGIEFAGSSDYFLGVGLTGGSSGSGVPVKFNAALSGNHAFVFVGCVDFFKGGAVSMGPATDPGFQAVGSDFTGDSVSSAVGASQTPKLYLGNDIVLTAASGGAGTVTVNAPATVPLIRGSIYNFTFVNASGGAVTWTLNAIFVTSAAIPTTNGHTIGVSFRWDGAKLREIGRADTVT